MTIYQDDHFAGEIVIIILRGNCVIKTMLKEYLVTRETRARRGTRESCLGENEVK